ncbi:MAG: glycoside hydrolase family 2 protein, partial [Bacteroidales bacterium]
SFPETLSDVHFIQLSLTEDGKKVSENFYWRGKEEGNLKALLDVPHTQPEVHTKVKRRKEKWTITVRLHNTSSVPCLMLHVQVAGKKSKKQMLPALYSDNFFSLMPGEKKKITITVKNEDTRGEKPAILIDGFNISAGRKRLRATQDKG